VLIAIGPARAPEPASTRSGWAPPPRPLRMGGLFLPEAARDARNAAGRGVIELVGSGFRAGAVEAVGAHRPKGSHFAFVGCADPAGDWAILVRVRGA